MVVNATHLQGKVGKNVFGFVPCFVCDRMFQPLSVDNDCGNYIFRI